MTDSPKVTYVPDAKAARAEFAALPVARKGGRGLSIPEGALLMVVPDHGAPLPEGNGRARGKASPAASAVLAAARCFKGAPFTVTDLETVTGRDIVAHWTRALIKTGHLRFAVKADVDAAIKATVDANIAASKAARA